MKKDKRKDSEGVLNRKRLRSVRGVFLSFEREKEKKRKRKRRGGREVKVRSYPVCVFFLFGASPSAIVSDMEAYQNGRDRADVFVSL